MPHSAKDPRNETVILIQTAWITKSVNYTLVATDMLGTDLISSPSSSIFCLRQWPELDASEEETLQWAVMG